MHQVEGRLSAWGFPARGLKPFPAKRKQLRPRALPRTAAESTLGEHPRLPTADVQHKGRGGWWWCSLSNHVTLF